MMRIGAFLLSSAINIVEKEKCSSLWNVIVLSQCITAFIIEKNYLSEI
jgi:hypothetical protein